MTEGPSSYEKMIEDTINVTKKLLEENGEFYPVLQVMDKNEQATFIGIDTGEEKPDMQSLLNEYIALVKEKSKEGEISAFALCFDGRMKDEQGNMGKDAICVKIEKDSGESILKLIPYTKETMVKITYDEIITKEVDREIF
jgi:hypothetical protein